MFSTSEQQCLTAQHKLLIYCESSCRCLLKMSLRRGVRETVSFTLISEDFMKGYNIKPGIIRIFTLQTTVAHNREWWLLFFPLSLSRLSCFPYFPPSLTNLQLHTSSLPRSLPLLFIIALALWDPLVNPGITLPFQRNENAALVCAISLLCSPFHLPGHIKTRNAKLCSSSHMNQSKPPSGNVCWSFQVPFQTGERARQRERGGESESEAERERERD